jgi:hypothetical protein
VAVASASPEERGEESREVSEGYRIRFMTHNLVKLTQGGLQDPYRRKRAPVVGHQRWQESLTLREKRLTTPLNRRKLSFWLWSITEGCFQPEGDAHLDLEEEEEAPMEMVRRGPLTRLKYNRFKGDGETDVDDWLVEFVATAQAKQEDLESRLRVFAGLLKGEALKW